jgi:hypothetical protein
VPAKGKSILIPDGPAPTILISMSASIVQNLSKAGIDSPDLRVGRT